MQGKATGPYISYASSDNSCVHSTQLHLYTFKLDSFESWLRTEPHFATQQTVTSLFHNLINQEGNALAGESQLECLIKVQELHHRAAISTPEENNWSNIGRFWSSHHFCCCLVGQERLLELYKGRDWSNLAQINRGIIRKCGWIRRARSLACWYIEKRRLGNHNPRLLQFKMLSGAAGFGRFFSLHGKLAADECPMFSLTMKQTTSLQHFISFCGLAGRLAGERRSPVNSTSSGGLVSVHFSMSGGTKMKKRGQWQLTWERGSGFQGFV